VRHDRKRNEFMGSNKIRFMGHVQYPKKQGETVINHNSQYVKRGEMMVRNEGFSVVLEPQQKLEIGDQIYFNGRKLVVTSIRKIEYVTSRLVSVSGNGKAV